MSTGFARRQLALAALALNAVRPLPGGWGGIPSFALGWPVSELAPHLLTGAAIDTAAELTVRRRSSSPSTTGLVAAAAAAGLLGWTIAGARRVGAELDEALRDSIGADYLSTLDLPGPVDLRLPRGSVARPFRLRQHDVEVLTDVPYTEGGRRAKMDIYKPRDRDLSGAPVLIQIHGGGWTIGTKEQQGLILMNRMAQQGWICISANYRLAPKHSFPTQIIDVKRAIAWVHENIEQYGGDPSYVAITGGSAGGHLAALAALTPGLADYQPGFEDSDTSVSACVPFYGIYDLAGLSERTVGHPDARLVPRPPDLPQGSPHPPRRLRPGLPAGPRRRAHARLLRHPRRQRHPRPGAPGPILRRGPPGEVGREDHLRRDPRSPARLRRLLLHPQPAHHRRGPTLAAVAPSESTGQLGI